MAGSRSWRTFAVLIGSAAALMADEVVIKSVANDQYVGFVFSADGVSLAANAPTADTAATFELFYPGNGYFVVQTGLVYLAFPDQINASVSDTGDLLSSSAPRSNDHAIAIKLHATGLYLTADPNQNGLLTASAPDAIDDSEWFTIETVASTQPSITLDFAHQRQTIQGFGAAVAYYANWLTAHPNKQDIYTALFDPVNGLGMSVLRVQNIFRYQSDPNFDPDIPQIVNAAAAIQGNPIALEMSSWTPPASLKSNQSENCAGTLNCTLATTNGSFNYAGFASYWADSLAAYANLGVTPTWISIQNEPDWIASYGSCRFDPSEDTVGGIHYAGYNQALDAVANQLSQMAAPPIIIGPEVLGIGYNDLTNYMAQLNTSQIGAIAHHLYHGGVETSPDSFNPVFESIQTNYGATLPRFMTEFGRGTGFETAWLIHNSLAVEEASLYMYWAAVWPDNNTLIYIDFPWDKTQWVTPQGWTPNDQYYGLEHFSRFIRPGFSRVTALTNQPGLRVTAFQSADASRIVVVAINTSNDTPVNVALGFNALANFPSSVYRTSFGDPAGERFAPIGPLDSNNGVSIPPQGAVTVVLDATPEAMSNKRRTR